MTPRSIFAELIAVYAFRHYDHGRNLRAMIWANRSMRVQPNLAAVWARVFVARTEGLLHFMHDDLDLLLRGPDWTWDAANLLISEANASSAGGRR